MGKYAVPYFFGRKRSDSFCAPRKKAGGARARNAVEDINGRCLASGRDEEGILFMPQTALLRLEADRGFVSHLAKPDTKAQCGFWRPSILKELRTEVGFVCSVEFVLSTGVDCDSGRAYLCADSVITFTGLIGFKKRTGRILTTELGRSLAAKRTQMYKEPFRPYFPPHSGLDHGFCVDQLTRKTQYIVFSSLTRLNLLCHKCSQACTTTHGD
jgi:hypothetical protein